MAYKHLGSLGLEKLLQLLATEFASKVDVVEGKGLSSEDFTSALLAKLNGIEEGANKYTHATHTAQTLDFYKVEVDAEGHVVSATKVAKEDITALGIPGQDTTYVVATQDADGLMAASDKAKLDGIEAGANKYVHPTALAQAIDSIGIFKIKADAEGHITGYEAMTKADLVGLLGEATLTEAGLMSATDKTKLEGIATGAQVNVIEEIQVNGSKVDANGKAVNIAIPTGALASKSEVAEDDLSAELKEKVNAASEGNHSHANKALLDTYTQTEENLADAVAKKHEHANAEELAKIATGDKAKWDAAEGNANSYTDGKIATVNETLGTQATAIGTAQSTADEAKAAAATNAAAITSGDAATLQSAKDYADEKVAAQIASAYKAAGTVAYEGLPEPSATVEGNVYNISNDFTTDADFVEGAGNAYKAGTNVVVIEESEGVFKYDVLAMSFDGFVQEADIEELSASDVESAWTAVFGA